MITYKTAGVDVDAGNALVDRIKKMTTGIGGFAGLYPMPKGFKNPQLVGCTDGVGTKLKIAFLTNQHSTVGIDLVAMNVNDLLCCGARPLFFLDYFACGRLNVDTAETVIRGITEGCRQAECKLLGGETAEMPGFYADGEYDLAGFATGVVDKERVIDGRKIRPGDMVLGIPSSGLHSNGYSLVHKVIPEAELLTRVKEFLTPTTIYHKLLKPLVWSKTPSLIKGMAHITGGGFIDNMPRVLRKGLTIVVEKGSWPVPELFIEIQKRAQLPDDEMYRTLNMGIGLMLVVAPKDVKKIQDKIKTVYAIGRVESGSQGFRFA